MPELEFIGDWEPTEAQAIAAQFQQTLAKSLGVGDGGGAEVTVQQLEDNPIQTLVSGRQKKLIELLRQAGAKTFEGAALEKSAGFSADPEHTCGPDCSHSWDDYTLGGDRTLLKAVGSLKRDNQGRTYKMNANRRWERFSGGGGGGAMPEFRFSPEDGAFGRGVYFPVLQAPQGYMRLRVRANLSGPELIGDDELYALESDFAHDINSVLDAKGVRGIAQTEGQAVTLLCVRSPSDLQVLGAVADSGPLPPGNDYDYRLVNLTPADDHFVIDVEVSPAGAAIAPQGNELIKAASVFNGSALSGTVLTPVSTSTLDRGMLRAAVERCRLDGVPVGDVAIALVGGVPDYLPAGTYAYCLPSHGTIYLAHHDPAAAAGKHLRMLTRELRAAARVGAIPSDVALEVLLASQEVDGGWWLEHHIKRFTGAILAARVHDITTAEDVGPWGRYVGLLAGRGLAHWGSRRAIAECMAEDYRRAFDPAGFPNEITMLWDLAVPSIARMAQQELLSVLAGAPLEKRAKHQPGEHKTEGGKDYELTQGHRWKRVGHEVVHQADHVGQMTTAWAIGKHVGGAIAQVATAHGADPLAAQIMSETVVQAGAATALFAASGARFSSGEASPTPMDLAAYFVQQSAAAFVGKMAHHEADHLLQAYNASELVHQTGAIAAGKGAGVGTAVAASKTGLDRRLIEAVVSKAGHDLNLLRKLFENDFSKTAGDPAIALLYDLARVAAALASAEVSNA